MCKQRPYVIALMLFASICNVSMASDDAATAAAVRSTMGSLLSMKAPAPAINTQPGTLLSSSGAYQPDPSVSQAVKTYVKQVYMDNTQINEAELDQRMQGVDIAERFKPALATAGYPPNDLTSALACLVSTGFTILHDTDTTPAQDQKLWQQLAQGFSNTKAVQDMPDSQKQTIAETIYWSLDVLVGEALAARAGKPGFDMSEVKQNAITLLQNFGIDGNRLVIDDNGARI